MNPRLFYSCLGFLLLFPCTGYGQWKEPPATGSPQNTLPDRTTMVGQSGMGPLLIAKLIDRDANAKKHQAVVEVQTDGVRLVDSAAAHHQPRLDEAHLQYRLDDGAAQDSTSKTWAFANLSSGEHRIRVTLVSSDNHPMGKNKLLKVRVP